MLSMLNAAPVDSLLVAGLVVFVIVRQFRWRGAEPDRILRFPLWITLVGLGWVIWNVVIGNHANVLTFGALTAELAVAALVGLAMGSLTEFRLLDGKRQYRLIPWAVSLWALLVVLRVGEFMMFASLALPVVTDTAGIMLALGFNRLVNALVVRGRVMTSGGLLQKDSLSVVAPDPSAKNARPGTKPTPDTPFRY